MNRLKGASMKLLRPFAGLAIAAVLGAAVATAVVHETTGGTTVVNRTITAPAAANAADTTSTTTTVNDVYRRSARSVVEITVTTSSSGGGSSGPFGMPQQGSGTAQGSGFVIGSNGDIVTNHHVVEGATSIKVTFADGTTADAKLVGSDATTDLAVIHVDVPSSELHPLSFGDSSALQVGDAVVAIGDPYGLENTVTAGIVSALDRTITSPNNHPIGGAIQTDAAINSGNSGGPLLDLNGRVIGVNSQIESSSGGNIGIGFAVPSNTVKTVVAQLIADGKATHPYLGVRLSDSSDPAGAKVGEVASGAPADKAGLQTGDVITAVDGSTVTSSDQLVAALAAHSPGDQVELRVVRGGSTRTVIVTLGNRS
jgi:putative serine protease PepD